MTRSRICQTSIDRARKFSPTHKPKYHGGLPRFVVSILISLGNKTPRPACAESQEDDIA